MRSKFQNKIKYIHFVLVDPNHQNCFDGFLSSPVLHLLMHWVHHRHPNRSFSYNLLDNSNEIFSFCSYKKFTYENYVEHMKCLRTKKSQLKHVFNTKYSRCNTNEMCKLCVFAPSLNFTIICSQK